MNVLDLFSGIGGFSLGLERAGMRTVAFCEIDPFCRRVLAKHWPGIPVYDDVRTLTAERLRADGISVDVICGGFPCQDISLAGKGAGIEGERSGLWSDYARIVGELRPRYVIVENVSALLSRGLDVVLGDLAALRYDAEWYCIPASAVGAPHRRDRIWIIASDTTSAGLSQRRRSSVEHAGETIPQFERPDSSGDWLQTVADTARDVRAEQTQSGTERQRTGASCQPFIATDPHGDNGGSRRARRPDPSCAGQPEPVRALQDMADTNSTGRIEQRWGISIRAQLASAECAGWWRTEPDVGRVAHGIPARVDRLRSLGNAVVPQIPELIGRAIMSAATVAA